MLALKTKVTWNIFSGWIISCSIWNSLNVAFDEKVWCGSKNYSKSLSWAENLNFPPQTVNNIFKFSAQDSDLDFFLSCIKFSDKMLSLEKTLGVFINLKLHCWITDAKIYNVCMTWSCKEIVEITEAKGKLY